MAFRSVCYNETFFFLLFHSSDSDLPEVRWHDDVQVGCSSSLESTPTKMEKGEEQKDR